MKGRIMIVDDEPAIVDAIQYALETEGFETETHYLGEPAKDALAQRPADLVILDLGLPDVNGLDLFRDIRKASEVPVIFLTARADEVDRIVGLELGADDYITKPFSPREVSARVKAVLRRTGTGEKGAEISGAVFTVNESKRRIRFHGELLDLSRYEYEILRTFINRPGHVFTRERIMEIVWEHPEASLDRTIDAHIKNIRAKLKRIRSGSDPIITHRGTGYSLRDDL
jgi:two-component system catabolic regulation response regulator CreB